jgi:hypothetical protein
MQKLWYYELHCFDGFIDILVSDRPVGIREVPEIPGATPGVMHRVREMRAIFSKDNPKKARRA